MITISIVNPANDDSPSFRDNPKILPIDLGGSRQERTLAYNLFVTSDEADEWETPVLHWTASQDGVVKLEQDCGGSGRIGLRHGMTTINSGRFTRFRIEDLKDETYFFEVEVRNAGSVVAKASGTYRIDRMNLWAVDTTVPSEPEKPEVNDRLTDLEKRVNALEKKS